MLAHKKTPCLYVSGSVWTRQRTRWVSVWLGHLRHQRELVYMRLCAFVCGPILSWGSDLNLEHKGDTGSDQTVTEMNSCNRKGTRAHKYTLYICGCTHFWSYVVWSATEGPRADSFCHVLFTHAKVSNLNVSLRVQHHVVQLQIPEEAGGNSKHTFRCWLFH